MRLLKLKNKKGEVTICGVSPLSTDYCLCGKATACNDLDVDGYEEVNDIYTGDISTISCEDCRYLINTIITEFKTK